MKHPLTAVILAFSLVGCTRAKPQDTSVSMTFPKTSEFLAKRDFAAGGSSIDYNSLCFVVNVTGPNISSQPNSCDVTKGLVAGSVAPGGTLSISVPVGDGMSFEVYGLLRTSASDPCPGGITGPWNWPLRQIYFLGRTSNVSVQPPSASVDVDISLPNSANNFMVSSSLPKTCLPAFIPSASQEVGRLSIAAGLLKSNTHILYSRINSVAELKQLGGNQVLIKNWKPQAQ